MKRFTFEIVIEEGNDEFWESITAGGKSGCDEVLEMVKNDLWQQGLDEQNCSIKLVKFVDN